jgi:hypothetical protein
MEAVARTEKELVADRVGVRDDNALLPEELGDKEGEAEAVAQPVPLCVRGADTLAGALWEA